MPKYRLKNFIQNSPSDLKNSNSRSTNLLDIAALELNSNTRVISSSLAHGTSETDKMSNGSLSSFLEGQFYDDYFSKYRDITKMSSDYIAFFDKAYPLRREYLRQFAKNGEINFVLETIADEAIIYNKDKYFADVDLTMLKSRLNKDYEDADKLVEIVKESFKHVYESYGWDMSNDAWDYFKKFLSEGFLAFEIIYFYDNAHNAVSIKAFKELDPITLEPGLMQNPNGEEIKVWWQYKGDAERERVIPDTNLIYISWSKGNFSDFGGRVSYLEGLTRSFNMLRQLENARIMWNIQNSQKRIKISVPLGTMNIDRARARISELKAYYNEDTEIDTMSGEVTVNGQPKFSFMKTYMFPSINGSSPEISEIGVQGYDMSSVDQLKYFWRRFILETKVPANRFSLDPTSGGGAANPLTGDAAITREEYAFSRFIIRVQTIFKELLLKPLWIQVCLKMPSLKYANAIKTCLNIIFNEENLFVSQKEQAILSQGAQTVGTLSSIQGHDGKPMFSPEFLGKKFLLLSDEDWELNEKYKQAEEYKAAKAAKSAKAKAAETSENAPEGPEPMGLGQDTTMPETGENDLLGGLGGLGGGEGAPDLGLPQVADDLGGGEAPMPSE